MTVYVCVRVCVCVCVRAYVIKACTLNAEHHMCVQMLIFALHNGHHAKLLHTLFYLSAHVRRKHVCV